MTNPPMDSERFGAYIERRLSLHDDSIQVIDRDRLELRLLVREREMTVDLTSYFRAYRQNPGQIDAVARTLERVLLDELPTETESDYEQLADRIGPMFKPLTLLADVRERGLTMLVYREFLAGLMIVYVIEEQRGVSFINEEHLDRWGITAQELHERSIANLRRRTANLRFTTVGEGDQRLYIINTGDGYDASRLLLTDLLAPWARTLAGKMVIGIPNRDFLIAFGDANQDILRSLALQIQVDSVQETHGLTEQLFTLDRGSVHEYEWE